MENHQEVKPAAARIPPLELAGIGLPSGNTPAPARPRAGDLCPSCGTERLDYDGLLNLACPECGVIAGGCFT